MTSLGDELRSLGQPKFRSLESDGLVWIQSEISGSVASKIMEMEGTKIIHFWLFFKVEDLKLLIGCVLISHLFFGWFLRNLLADLNHILQKGNLD